jgi:hypothetical protein
MIDFNPTDQEPFDRIVSIEVTARCAVVVTRPHLHDQSICPTLAVALARPQDLPLLKTLS